MQIKMQSKDKTRIDLLAALRGEEKEVERKGVGVGDFWQPVISKRFVAEADNTNAKMRQLFAK